MPDFIETLAFEEMSLVSREHSSIEAIRVWRDNNYNLKTCMRLKSGSINPFQGDAISIVEQMIGASRTLNLTDSGPGFLRVQLRGIVIESSQVGDGFAEIAGSVGSLRREYGSEAIGAPTFAIAWFVNSPQELLFPDSSQLKGRTTEVYTWGEFASDSYEHEGPWRAARNVIQLQYDGVSFLFGKTSKEHPGSFPCSFIRFHHHEHLPKAREIAGVLSFALGLSLIPIGETTFNAASSPVSIYFRSSFEGALRRIVDLPQRPIVPVRVSDVVHLGHNPVIALNQLLEGYAQQREKYELGKILWYIDMSRQLSPLIRAQAIATAFDLLCTHHYREKGNAIIEKRQFRQLSDEVEKLIEDVISDLDTREEIAGKIPLLNQRSLNKRNQNVFEDFAIRLSEAERDALHSRNTAVHGRVGEIDVPEAMRNSSLFSMLVTRLILKVMGAPVYLDWSLTDAPVKGLEQPQGGHYSISSIQF